MSAVVMSLPNEHDREIISVAAKIWLETRDYQLRQSVSDKMSGVMNTYGVTKIKSENLLIRLVGEKTIVESTQKITEKTCPQCGADIYKTPGDVRIIFIKEGFGIDKVTYGCLCGAIFYKNERNDNR